MTLNKGTRTRKDWLISEFSDTFPDDAEGMAESALRTENTLIWAWYRDPETSLTQLEARERAQGKFGAGRPKDYGRFNISQSSISRLINRLDDRVLLEPLQVEPFNRSETREDYEGHECLDGGVCDRPGHELKAKHAPELLDARRSVIARSIIDWRALKAFERADYRTPDWALDRFDIDPNTGLALEDARATDDPNLTPHEPHDTS